MTIIAFRCWNAVLRCACHYCNVMMQGQWSTRTIQLQFTECGFIHMSFSQASIQASIQARHKASHKI